MQAMQERRPLHVALGLVLLAVLVGGSAAASVHATPALTLKGASVEAKYREGWLVGPNGAENTTGRVSFTVTLRTAATLTAVLRRVSREGSPFPVNRTFRVQRGTRTLKLPLFRRHAPGVYRLRVSGSSNAGDLRAVERRVRLPAPAEGVVDRAILSATPGGPRARVLVGPREMLFARFHFLAPPKTQSVTIEWRSPSYELVEERTQPYRRTTYTRVGTPGTRLESGVWYCILEARGIVAKRISVRIQVGPDRRAQPG